MVDNIGTLLSERARISAEMEAEVDVAPGLRLNWRELDDKVNRVANTLAGRVAKGDRLAILAGNSHWYVVMLFAAARLGAIAVPLNWRLTAPELSYQITDCAPNVTIFDAANAALASTIAEAGTDTTWLSLDEGDDALLRLCETASTQAIDRAVGPDDGLLILYTSGTTGRPKGALHTHGSSLGWCASTLASFENRMGDRQLLVAPLFHIAGICVMLNSVHRGFTLVIAPGFDPGEAWRLIEAERITSMFAVPTMINMMREHENRNRYSHESLRWIMCGAAPVPVTLIDAYAELGIDIHQVYGSTEAHGGIAVLPPAYAHSKKGSTGLACFGVEIRVVDVDGNDVPPGKRGEIITRGPHVFREYWGLPEATRDSSREGWFYLGDIGEMDAEGFITILDRSKDMIISGGENIYPAEVENVLMGHPAILEAAVIGRAHERWGETPVALVVRREGLASSDGEVEAELFARCEQNLGRFKRPVRYHFIDQLPRNASGKVLKHVLRDMQFD